MLNRDYNQLHFPNDYEMYLKKNKTYYISLLGSQTGRFLHNKGNPIFEFNLGCDITFRELRGLKIQLHDLHFQQRFLSIVRPALRKSQMVLLLPKDRNELNNLLQLIDGNYCYYGERVCFIVLCGECNIDKTSLVNAVNNDPHSLIVDLLSTTPFDPEPESEKDYLELILEGYLLKLQEIQKQANTGELVILAQGAHQPQAGFAKLPRKIVEKIASEIAPLMSIEKRGSIYHDICCYYRRRRFEFSHLVAFEQAAHQYQSTLTLLPREVVEQIKKYTFPTVSLWARDHVYSIVSRYYQHKYRFNELVTLEQVAHQPQSLLSSLPREIIEQIKHDVVPSASKKTNNRIHSAVSRIYSRRAHPVLNAVASNAYNQNSYLHLLSENILLPVMKFVDPRGKVEKHKQICYAQLFKSAQDDKSNHKVVSGNMDEKCGLKRKM